MNPNTRHGAPRVAGFLRSGSCSLGAWLLPATRPGPGAHRAPSSGSVKDSTGAAVPGADVTATHLGTQFSRTSRTDPTGQYSLPLLPSATTRWRSR